MNYSGAQVASVTGPYGYGLTFTYDGAGRPTTVAASAACRYLQRKHHYQCQSALSPIPHSRQSVLPMTYLQRRYHM